ncbi:UxaA family hydrolase [Marinomonas epiphytica]
MEKIISTSLSKRLHQKDNLAVAITALPEGAEVEGVTLIDKIPAGHKFSVQGLSKGEHIIKYGQVIGYAACSIEAGSHLHSHNIKMLETQHSLNGFLPMQRTSILANRRSFQGFARSNGQVGTRNYIGVISTVNCSATVSKVAAEQLNLEGELEALGYDGVVAITHGSGCGMSTGSEGYALFDRVIQGYAAHPNFAFVFVVGLGCETYQIKALRQNMDEKHGSRIHYFNIQEAGGTRESIRVTKDAIYSKAQKQPKPMRQEVGLEHLCVALQCGGSDGYSGITANPALGYASDLIVRNGGKVILSETPEIYGAEHLLLSRAIHKSVAEKLLKRIDWWKQYTRMNKAELNNNPSPGNKQGGLTTILEKSLGAVAKSGTSSLNDVLEYAEPCVEQGFNFMDSPGYDPVSVTGQIASGANLVCFTTGRGSVAGFKPAPCIKLATNTLMYARLKEDMDINCGVIVDGKQSIEQVGEDIFDKIIAIASGEQSASELLGYGSNEFVPWPLGAVI